MYEEVHVLGYLSFLLYLGYFTTQFFNKYTKVTKKNEDKYSQTEFRKRSNSI